MTLSHPRIFNDRQRHPRRRFRDGLPLTLALAILVLLPWSAVELAAQTVSPGSISINPSDACGGGVDAGGEVCVTLPSDSTCNLVDVFLLFDNTGSFDDYTEITGDVFQTIVDDLQLGFPSTNFAFGVGRFEDFGGPGAGFGNTPRTEDRPFILNQALIRADSPGFLAELEVALMGSGSGSGHGGDGPESAIEALYQIATGFGFNGNPNTNSSVRDSEETSGDVPDFASYTGSKSGALGGVGWRANSCLRLVLLATDFCTVAPFPRSEPIPDAIEGAGGSIDSSAFSCFGGARYGHVAQTEDEASDPGTIAPVGAATVQQTVDALNDLGIRVLGLGPDAAPTASTAATSDESTFLSALAHLTGAVDASGDPLVFDIQKDPTVIKQAIENAVETSLTTPIDITLAPDPPLDGLAVISSPPVQEDVGPGETACFSVDFEGDDTFEGGSFGLTFLDQASNGSLGMTIPTTLRCPDCFDLVTRKLLCDADENGFTGTFEWEFLLRNRTNDPIYHLFFVDLPAGVEIEIVDLLLPMPIQPGRPQVVTTRVHGATPGQLLDFRITLHNQNLDMCCAEEVQLELPDCDCAQLRTESSPSCFSFPFFTISPPWRYSFDLENLTTSSVQYLLLAPVSPADHDMPLSPGELTIDPNVIFLPTALGGGDETGFTSVFLSGPAARPGDEVCFRISTHDFSFDDCCSFVKCTKIPDCTFGAVDFEELGTAELVYSGDSLIVSGLRGSGDVSLGENGVAGDFGPSRTVDVGLQDFSLGVELEEGASIRFAGSAMADGEMEEVASVDAKLEAGKIAIAPSGPDPQEILILRDGQVVATAGPDASVSQPDGIWPTRLIIMDENLTGVQNVAMAIKDLITTANIAGVAWAEPVSLSLDEGCGGAIVQADEVRFRFEAGFATSGFVRSELTATSIDALTIKRFDLGGLLIEP